MTIAVLIVLNLDELYLKEGDLEVLSQNILKNKYHILHF